MVVVSQSAGGPGQGGASRRRLPLSCVQHAPAVASTLQPYLSNSSSSQRSWAAAGEAGAAGVATPALPLLRLPASAAAASPAGVAMRALEGKQGARTQQPREGCVNIRTATRSRRHKSCLLLCARLQPLPSS